MQVLITSSSVTFLFITSRRRCVPASGANVSPLRLTLLSCSTNSSEKLSTLKDGSERFILSFTVQSISVVSILFTSLWSEVESEQSESSS